MLQTEARVAGSFGVKNICDESLGDEGRISLPKTNLHLNY
jgi:hypothetical protein